MEEQTIEDVANSLSDGQLFNNCLSAAESGNAGRLKFLLGIRDKVTRDVCKYLFLKSDDTDVLAVASDSLRSNTERMLLVTETSLLGKLTACCVLLKDADMGSIPNDVFSDEIVERFVEMYPDRFGDAVFNQACRLSSERAMKAIFSNVGRSAVLDAMDPVVCTLLDFEVMELVISWLDACDRGRRTASLIVSQLALAARVRHESLDRVLVSAFRKRLVAFLPRSVISILHGKVIEYMDSLENTIQRERKDNKRKYHEMTANIPVWCEHASKRARSTTL